jgi:hypothetical protein
MKWKGKEQLPLKRPIIRINFVWKESATLDRALLDKVLDTIHFFNKSVTPQQLMEYVCNFKQYFATCFGVQEAIIRQIHT